MKIKRKLSDNDDLIRHTRVREKRWKLAGASDIQRGVKIASDAILDYLSLRVVQSNTTK